MAVGGVVNEVLLEEKLVGVFLRYQRHNHRQNCLKGLFIQTMESAESLGVFPIQFPYKIREWPLLHTF